MSTGEIAYLAMVLTAFATFISVVGFISVWSRKANKTNTVSLPSYENHKTADDARAHMIRDGQPASIDRAA